MELRAVQAGSKSTSPARRAEKSSAGARSPHTLRLAVRTRWESADRFAPRLIGSPNLNFDLRKAVFMTSHVSESIVDTHEIEYDDAFALAGQMQRIMAKHRLTSEIVSIENEDGESISGFDLREEVLTDGSKVYTLIFKTL